MGTYRYEGPPCDHAAIGVVLKNTRGEYGIVGKHEFGNELMPPTWHAGLPEAEVPDSTDWSFGAYFTAESTATERLHDMGIALSLDGLARVIDPVKLNNPCLRQWRENHHYMTVYHVDVGQDQIDEARAEASGLAWYSPRHLQTLADVSRLEVARGLELPMPFNPATGEPRPAPESGATMNLMWLGFLRQLNHVR